MDTVNNNFIWVCFIQLQISLFDKLFRGILKRANCSNYFFSENALKNNVKRK